MPRRHTKDKMQTLSYPHLNEEEEKMIKESKDKKENKEKGSSRNNSIKLNRKFSYKQDNPLKKLLTGKRTTIKVK